MPRQPLMVKGPSGLVGGGIRLVHEWFMVRGAFPWPRWKCSSIYRVPRSCQAIVLSKRYLTGDSIEPVSDIAQLPDNCYAPPPPPDVQKTGGAWAKGGARAVLRVPSAVIPAEFNYLVNPGHPDSCKIVYGAPRRFIFGGRLLKPA
jgi:hypothetical protein